MALFRRIGDLLLAPSSTWRRIAEETTAVRTLYTAYLGPLAGIAAVASWIGLSLVGYSVDGQRIQLAPLAGLTNALVGFALTLLSIDLLARFANRLAPNFGGQPDRGASLRLIAYSSTPAVLGGIVSVIPQWAGLALIPTLYAAFILARGIPLLMRSNPERNLSYTTILLIGALALGTINGALLAALR